MTETRSSSGFTIIELLIVIGILSIMMALAAPNLTGYVQRLRFQEGVRTFSESLLQARDTASSGSLTVRVEAGASELVWYDQQDDTVLGRTGLPHRTTLVDNHTVVLSGRGLPAGQTRFDLTDGEHTRSIWLLPTGAILR